MVRKRKAPPSDTSKPKRKRNGNGRNNDEKRNSKTNRYLKAGQPTKYDSNRHPQKVIEVMSKGKMRCHLVSALEVSAQTILNWEKKYPEFFDALKTGRDLSMQVWIKKAEDAMLLPKDLRFNAAPWIFIMKNVFGWTDKREIEQTESREVKFTFDLSGASTEELKKLKDLPAEEKRKRIKVA